VIPEDVKNLKKGDYSHFSAEYQAALRYAERMTKGPTNTASEEADALKKHFSDVEIVDIIAEVALVNLTNRITDGLGLELEMAAEKI
jgi:alkylhydroperoxidase family enzyme